MKKSLWLWAVPALLATPAWSDVSVYNDGKTEIKAALRADAAYFSSVNTNFGQGLKADGNTRADWSEWVLEPSLTGRYTYTGQKYFYGGFSTVFTKTDGDGDVAGFTPGQPEDIAVDHAYLGWNSGPLKSATLGDYSIDASFGRQPFMIGDGFLIKDGVFDLGEQGAFWLAPRDAFEMTGILKIETRPVRSEWFYLRGGAYDQAASEIYGVNLEYVTSETGRIGTYFLNMVDSNPLAFNPTNPNSRDGLKTLSVRGNGNPFEDAPGVFLSSEWAYQWNDRSQRPVRAWAGYAEAGYTWQDTKWTPGISYRFATYSGDRRDSSNDEAFDSLFYGISRGWGTWFHGEIIGAYWIPNTNVRLHQVHAKMVPSPDTVAGIVLYQYNRVEPVVGAASNHYGNELNAYFEWQALDNLRLMSVYSVAAAGEAAEAEFGNNDKRFHLVQFVASLSF